MPTVPPPPASDWYSFGSRAFLSDNPESADGSLGNLPTSWESEMVVGSTATVNRLRHAASCTKTTDCENSDQA